VELNSATDIRSFLCAMRTTVTLSAAEIFTAAAGDGGGSSGDRDCQRLGGISGAKNRADDKSLTSMLPAFLTPEPGLNSGFMIAQVTAAALHQREQGPLQRRIPLNSISEQAGNQEDYVSMGMSGAAQAGTHASQFTTHDRDRIAVRLPGSTCWRSANRRAGKEASDACAGEVG